MSGAVMLTHRIAALAATVALAAVTSTFAQPAVTVSVGQAFDAWSAAGDDTNEHRTALAAAVERAFAGVRGRVWASGDVSTYSSPGDWTSVQLASGASWRQTLVRDRAALHVGGTGLVRQNGESWTSANLAAAGAFANLEWTPRDTASARAGYSIDARRFDDLAALDHVQHTAFASGLVNLPTRTTFIAEAAIGAKRYRGGVATPIAPVVTDPTHMGPGMAAIGGTNGQAPGGNGVQATAGTSASAVMATPGVVDAAGAGAVTAHLFTLYGRVAQSLAARTALVVEGLRRTTGGDVPPALVTTPVELLEDGLYDDPYASDASDVRVTLRHVFARGVDLEASAARLDKPFRMTQALTALGLPLGDGVLRHDRVVRAHLSGSVPLLPSRTGDWKLALVVRGDYVSHESNDALAAYTSRALTLGMTVGR